MKTKSDWLFGLLLTTDCRLMEVASRLLPLVDPTEVVEDGGGWSVAGVSSNRGRLSSEVDPVESLRPEGRNIVLPIIVINSLSQV